MSVVVSTGSAAQYSAGRTTAPGPTVNPANGQVQWTFRLDLPHGSNDLTPELALRWDAGAPNFLFGSGFRLSIPSIQWQRDGKLELTGQGHLVETAEGPRRLRFDPCSLRVQSDGDGWLLSESGGRTLRFGDTPQSREPHDGTPGTLEVWHLAAIEDALGGRISYEYRTLEGRVVPDRILYGPYAVRFVYEARPDAVLSTIGQEVQRLSHRCSEILLELLESDRPLIRRWRFKYTPSRIAGRSLLTSIGLEGMSADGATSAWPDVHLDFELPPAAEEQVQSIEVPGGIPTSPSEGRAGIVHWHGRGRPSLFDIRPDGLFLWNPAAGGRLDEGRRVAPVPIEFLEDPDATAFADLDGTGRPDLVVLSATAKGRYRLREEGGFGDFEPFVTAPAELLATREAAFVDLDGNGMVDLLVTDPAAGEARGYLRDERGDWAGEVRVAKLAAGEVPPLSLADAQVRLADLTGDGTPDFVRIENDHLLIWAGVGIARWAAEPRQVNVTLPAGIGGLTDARVLLTDLTGDGSADLVAIVAGRIVIFTNRGGAEFLLHADVTVAGLTDPRDVVATDLQGEGRQGLIVWDRSGASALGYIRSVADGDVPRLRSVRNGLGVHTTFEYASSVAMQEQAEVEEDPWHRFLPFPLMVAAASTTTDAVNGERQRHEYRYRDGAYSARFRSLLGFAHSSIVEDASTEAPSRRVRFDHAIPAQDVTNDDELALAGAVLSTAVEARKDDRWLTQQVSLQRWEVVPFGNGTSRRRRLAHAETREHDHAGLAARTVATDMTYDRWDNVARERQRAFDSSGAATVLMTHVTMAEDPRERFLRKTVRVEQFDGDGILVAHSRMLYDDLPFGAVGESGALTRVETQVFTDEMAGQLPASVELQPLGYHRISGEAGWWRTERRFNRSTNASGQLTLKVTSALGAETTTSYDDHQLHPVEMVDPDGLRVRTIPDAFSNRPAEVEEATGYIRRYRYDGLTRPITVSSSSYQHAIQRFHAEAGDQGTLVESETLLDDDKEQYSRRTVLHDGLGREVRSSLFVDGTAVVERQRRHSLRGLLVEDATQGAAEPARYFYDALGRPVRIEQPGGDIHVVECEGDWIRFGVRDGESIFPVRRIRLDGRRRPLEVITGEGTNVQRLTFHRDVRGQVTRAELPGDRVRTWTFDLTGQELVSESPEQGRRVSVRDAEGRVRQIWKEGDKSETFSYSPVGALRDRALGTSERLFASMTYGPAGSSTADPRRGRLTSIAHEWGTSSHSYSPEGWITETHYARAGAPDLVLKYRYRPDGQVSEVVYPGGRILRYEYDAAGRLQRVPGFIRGIVYRPDGLIGQVVAQNGVRTDVTRHADGRRVDRLTITGGADQPLLDLAYHRDHRGNLLEIATEDPLWRRRIGNDALDRVASETDGAERTVTYRFDDAGRLTENSDVGAIRYTKNRLEAVAARAIEIDRRGRRVRDGGRRFTYSEADHLRNAAAADGATIRSYQYDAADQPVLALDGQGQTVWFSPDPRLVQTAAGLFGFLYVAGQLVARFALDQTSPPDVFFHADAFGYTTLITDQAGAAVRRLRYSASALLSGEPTTPPDEALEPCSAGIRFVPALDLYAYGRRFYDPSAAAFLTPDPAVTMPLMPMTWTGHGYLAGNPYRYADPTGWFLDGIGDFFRSVGNSIGQFFDRYGKYILAAIAVVAVAVLVIASGGTLGLLLGGMLVGGLVGGIAAANQGGDVLMGVLVGMALGGLGAWGGAAAASSIGASTFWTAVASGAVKGAIMGAAVGAAAGYAGGAGSMEQILSATAKGAIVGAVAGAVFGGLEYSMRGATYEPWTLDKGHKAGTNNMLEKLPQGSDPSGGANFMGRALSEGPGNYAMGFLGSLVDVGKQVAHYVLASPEGFAVTVGVLAGIDATGYGDDLVDRVLGSGVLRHKETWTF